MDAGYAWKLSKFGRLTSHRLRFDDDLADRLNYQFTGLLLFIFIGLIGIRQYTGKPIQCFTPQEFTRSWEEYAENYCWVSSTFFHRKWSSKDLKMSELSTHYQQNVNLKIDRSLGTNAEKYDEVQRSFNIHGYPPPSDSLSKMENKRLGEPYEINLVKMVNYYQWAPIFLAIQALLFYIPCLIWRLLQSRSGFQLKRMMQLSAEASTSVPESIIPGSESMKTNMKPVSIKPVAASTPRPTNIHEWHSHNKSAKSLARYIDACLQRQIDLRESRFRGKSQKLVNVPIPSAPKENSVHGIPSETSEKPPPLLKNTNKPKRSFLCCFPNCFHYINKSLSKSKSASQVYRLINDPERGVGSDFVIPKSYCLDPFCCYVSGNYLVSLYFLIKILYIINILGQMYLMEVYTGINYNFYGIRVLYDLIQGIEWDKTGNFPRVTFCDFQAIKFGVNYSYILQCVLPINMLLEKVYIFLWLWFLLLGLVTLLSLVYWSSNLITSRCRIIWIHRQLSSLRIFNQNSLTVIQFVENYLGLDGIFVLQLIANNQGSMIVGDVIGELYLIYQQRIAPPVIPTRTNSSNFKSMSPSQRFKQAPNQLNLNKRAVRNGFASAQSRISPEQTSPTRQASGSKNEFKSDSGKLKMALESKNQPILVDPSYVYSRVPLALHGQPRGARRLDGTGGAGVDGRRALGLLGMEAEGNRDILRHPAEWLQMVSAQEAIGGGGSLASSRSGSERMGTTGLHLRMDIRDIEGRRSVSPPPIPNRGITPVSGQNSEDRSIRDDVSRQSVNDDFDMQQQGYYQAEDVEAEFDRDAGDLYLGENRDGYGMGYGEDEIGNTEDGVNGQFAIGRDEDRDLDQMSDMDTTQRNQDENIV